LEDDPLIRLDLETSLEDLGAIVLGASDLNAALTHLDAVPARLRVVGFRT
jgi:CheY-like chemotaxis protein